MKHPIARPDELIAKARANAVRAKRAGTGHLYRCPTCHDQGWTLSEGTTLGGHEGVEVARRCQGPTLTGCAHTAWQDKRRVEKATPRRGKMD